MHAGAHSPQSSPSCPGEEEEKEGPGRPSPRTKSQTPAWPAPDTTRVRFSYFLEDSFDSPPPAPGIGNCQKLQLSWGQHSLLLAGFAPQPPSCQPQVCCQRCPQDRRGRRENFCFYFYYLFICFFIIIILRQNLTMQPWLSCSSLCRPG